MDILYKEHERIYIRGTFPRRMRHITCYIRHRKPELYILLTLFEYYNIPEDLFYDFMDILGIEKMYEPITCSMLMSLSLPCYWCQSYYRDLDDIDLWEARHDPDFKSPVQHSCECKEIKDYNQHVCGECISKYFCKLCCNCNDDNIVKRLT